MSAAAPLRRKVSAPVDPELRAAIVARLDCGPAEPIAAAAFVSVATVRKAARGEPVRPMVRAALALAVASLAKVTP